MTDPDRAAQWSTWREILKCPLCHRPILSEDETHTMAMTFDPAVISFEDLSDAVLRYGSFVRHCTVTRHD